MGFFDLNIPYDTSHSSKTTRTKLVVKAMELGYSGVAYNHTMKGVMSDHNRCSIPLLSLSTLLNIAPSLASSVNLHRDLLGVPRDSPFRQYTRLTVSVDGPAQGMVLNSGNPVLKSYDLVAVRPLNQSAFDYACEKSEVDIISIDFTEKLPFRLKQHMVKAAVERGVFFEITYYSIIADVQVRKQVIPSVKLLVEWTRGKNLILSSAALSVNELRGPYDVANLSSLLGLSMERAKAAVSKNCRNLITNALRRKHFYKEAIRVEPISSDEKSTSNKTLSADWLKWDPISSGEGDLQLEDLAKSFSDTNMTRTVKAIDFASVIGSVRSHGENILASTGVSNTAITITDISEKTVAPDVLPETNRNVSFSGLPTTQTSELLPETNRQFCYNMSTMLTSENLVNESSQQLQLCTTVTKCSTVSEEIGASSTTTAEESKHLNGSDVFYPLLETEGHDIQPEKHIGSFESNILLPNENMMSQTINTEVELNAACVSEAELAIFSEKINRPSPQAEKYTSPPGSDAGLAVENAMADGNIMRMGMKDQEEDALMTENILDGEQLRRESSHFTPTLVDQNPLLPASDDVKSKGIFVLGNDQTLNGMVMGSRQHVNVIAGTDAKMILVLGDDLQDNSSTVDCVPMEVTMNEQKHKHEETDKRIQPIILPSLSGKSRAKRRTHHSPLLFPFKRLLHPMPFRRMFKKTKRQRLMG